MSGQTKRHLIGYAKASTNGQNLDLQLDKLRAAGVEEDDIVVDTASGAKAGRDELKNVLQKLRRGDCLVVCKLDRLGRNVKSILEAVETLQNSRVELISLSETIDTRTAKGKFVMHVLAAMAQTERDLTMERAIEGQNVARKSGVSLGRQNAMTPERVARARELLARGDLPKHAIAKDIGISRARLYNWLKEEANKGR